MPPDFNAMEAETPVRRTRPRAPISREPRRGGGGTAFIAILIVVVLLIAVAGVAYVFRDRLRAEFPQLAPYYDMIGIAPAPSEGDMIGIAPAPGEGLGLRDQSISQEEVDGLPVLVATGQIVNLSQIARPVPMLEASLVADGNRVINTWTFEVEGDELAPGASIPFTTRIENPPPEAKGLLIEFVVRTPGS